MKSINEIKDRIKKHINDPVESMFIQMCDDVHPLMMFVSDYYKDEYKGDVLELTEGNIITEMQEYIDFAFEKAYNQRGISAERSIWKFKQWLWALDDDGITDFHYEDYGVSLLQTISEKYSLKIQE